MATVYSAHRGMFVLLPPVAVLGRDPSSAINLPGPRASARHAEIRAHAGGWGIRDLASRNGTTVDGELLTPGLLRPLRLGSEIVFGDRDERWVVVDLAPPGPCLFDPTTGERIDPSDGQLGEHLAYDLDCEGWCLEGEIVGDGQRIGRYTLHLPTREVVMSTQPARIELIRARLRIVASADLARIDVHVEDGPERVSFADRAWGIALYVLALEHQSPSDGGWMDVGRLARLCGLDRKVLDVYLLRAREAFVSNGVSGGEQVIEVRRGIRRLGVHRVVIERADG